MYLNNRVCCKKNDFAGYASTSVDSEEHSEYITSTLHSSIILSHQTSRHWRNCVFPKVRLF